MKNKLTKRGLFLLAKLVSQKLSAYHFPEVTIADFDYIPNKYDIVDIQKAATHICRHYGLLWVTPLVTYENIPDAAGNINLNNSEIVYINIDKSKKIQ